MHRNDMEEDARLASAGGGAVLIVGLGLCLMMLIWGLELLCIWLWGLAFG